MPEENFDVIVVGAGIVGMSTALWAQMDGQRVLLCDPNPPGSGTTYGSACTIATYACLPVNSPTIFASLPQLLASRNSPLSFNLWHGLKNPRWMLSFLNNCRPSKVEGITTALGEFLSHADAGLNPLVAAAGAEDLMVSNDCLYIYSTQKGYEAARASNQARRAQGVDFEDLTADEVHRLEPNLKLPVHRGLLFKGARHVTDPQELVARMQRHFVDLGGVYRQQSVARCDPDDLGVTAHFSDGTLARGAYLGLTAGAFSKRIEGTGAERLPLGTERGYHILYRKSAGLISRPVGWAEAGFYATPMAHGLRIAGMVEIDSVDAPANEKCTDYLCRKSHEMFGALGAPDETWLGYRPTLPDSMPVIGPSAVSDRVIFAFGHQHIGLTLGGATGKIVADLTRGRVPNYSIAKFAADRF